MSEFTFQCKDCITYPICRNVLVDGAKEFMEGHTRASFRDGIYIAVMELEKKCSVYHAYETRFKYLYEYIDFVIDNFNLIEHKKPNV